MRFAGLHALVLVGFALLLSAAAGAWADEETGFFYTWKDEQGLVHVTDSLNKVPKEYRSKARKSEQGKGGVIIEERPAPAAPSGTQNSEQSDDALKAQWRQRMLDAKRRLASAEDRYRQLEQQKTELMSQWGSSGAALPPRDVLDKAGQLDKEMEAAQTEIDEARNEVESAIPDAARKAGVPPGWLRE